MLLLNSHHELRTPERMKNVFPSNLKVTTFMLGGKIF
jgi:hypothetical protein